MRCNIHTSRSVTSKGKCNRIFCLEKGDPGCGIVLYGKDLLSKLKIARSKQIELEEELVV